VSYKSRKLIFIGYIYVIGGVYMGDRMLYKNNIPTEKEIFEHIGNNAKVLLNQFEEAFEKQYDMM